MTSLANGLPPNAPAAPDAITLAVVTGTLGSTVRQMTIVMERTARSPVFKLGRDYSNAIFDWDARMIVQGADLPIHLGSLLHATKSVAAVFSDDVRPGNAYYHNDPTSGGSHLQDMCMFKPVFVGDELFFWVANKAHMDDVGGPVAGGYNFAATEIFAEGLRVPPIQIYEQGTPRRDVLELLAANNRMPDQLRNDMAAQFAALTVAERNLVQLVERYGKDAIRGAVERILWIGEQNMRIAISAMPDGVYNGRSCLEANDRFDEIEISCRIEILSDELQVSLESSPQIARYVNSYWANTLSAVYYGVLGYARLSPPFNEGIYRPIHVDLGPQGTLTNAAHPAPCGLSTTTVGDNIGDAVRDALAGAAPERALAAWGRGVGATQVSMDLETGRVSTFNMIIGASGGAGATWGLDGWPCLGLSGGGGGMMGGDIELLEHEHPVRIHRYELREDSGGAGRWRGGLGAIFEEEPVGHEATIMLRGEGFVHPAAGAVGARSTLVESKLARRYLVEGGASIEMPRNGPFPIAPGQRLQARPPGGGGVGEPFDRDTNAVYDDVRNGLVSLKGAREEYGVVFDPDTLELDDAATARLRGRRRDL